MSKVFVGCDYAQIELRVGAQYTRSPVMKETFDARESPHLRTLRDVFGVDDKRRFPEQYTLSKNINFGDFYGAGPDRLVEQARQGGVFTTRKIMWDAQWAKRRSDPVTWEWIQEERARVREEGCTTTLQGRVNYNQDVFSPDPKVAYDGVLMLVNSKIQGSASLICIEAMITFDRFVKRQLEKDWPIVIQIHDEIIVMADEAEAEYCLETLKKIMRYTAERYITFVPVEVEGSIAHTWAALK